MKFVRDSRGLGDLLKSPQFADLCADGARRGAAWIRKNAPVGKPPKDPHPGAFRDSVHTVDGAKSFVGDRVASLIIADSDDALANTFGNRRNKKPDKTLQKAIPIIENGG